jgi:hypothetical protein
MEVDIVIRRVENSLLLTRPIGLRQRDAHGFSSLEAEPILSCLPLNREIIRFSA